MHRLYCKEEEITYGQKYLLDICDKRQLSQFWQQNCMESFNFTYIFNIATGKQRSVSLAFINMLSKYVNPADWFYTVSETRPEPLPEGTKLTDDIRKSKNVQKIKELYEKGELFNFCKEKEINYKALMHVLNGRNLISYPKIKEMKELFAPLDWFIPAE